VHHAVEGSNLLEDLLTLCSRCHAREHKRKASAKEAIFLGREASREHHGPSRTSSNKI
jgi:predicted HNH restriction endonuclease